MERFTEMVKQRKPAMGKGYEEQEDNHFYLSKDGILSITKIRQKVIYKN